MKKRLIVAIVQIGLVLVLLIITIQLTSGRGGERKGEDINRLDVAMEDADEQGEMANEEELVNEEDLKEGLSDFDDKNAGEETARPDYTAGPKETARPGASSSPDPSASPVPLYQNVEFEIESQLGEIMYYWADNNMRAITELAFLEHNKAMSYSLTGSEDYYYYGDADASGVPDGQGIAVYADNRYYYGTWKDGKREGQGTFLHYHVYEMQENDDVYSYHFYTGGWAGDRPEGSGSEHYEFNMHNLQDGIGYNSNLIGSYKNGLYHGDFFITNIYSDNNTKEWDASATEGVFQYQNDSRDKKGRRAVQVDRADDDNYIWMYPADNKNLGVPCLNVSGKRRMEPN